MGRGMEFTDGSESVWKEHDAQDRQRGVFLLQLRNARLEMDAILAVDVITTAMPTEGEVRGEA